MHATVRNISVNNEQDGPSSRPEQHMKALPCEGNASANISPKRVLSGRKNMASTMSCRAAEAGAAYQVCAPRLAVGGKSDNDDVGCLVCMHWPACIPFRQIRPEQHIQSPKGIKTRHGRAAHMSTATLAAAVATRDTPPGDPTPCVPLARLAAVPAWRRNVERRPFMIRTNHSAKRYSNS